MTLKVHAPHPDRPGSPLCLRARARLVESDFASRPYGERCRSCAELRRRSTTPEDGARRRSRDGLRFARAGKDAEWGHLWDGRRMIGYMHHLDAQEIIAALRAWRRRLTAGRRETLA